jgi:hypothetical protein
MKAMVSWVKVSKEIKKELREIGKLRGEALPGGRQMREGLRGGWSYYLSGEQSRGSEEIERWEDRLFRSDFLEFSRPVVWFFDWGKIFAMVWGEFPHASAEGEYPGLVSVRVCHSDETSPDSSLSEIRLYLTIWLYSDESEVQCRNDGRGIELEEQEGPGDSDWSGHGP